MPARVKIVTVCPDGKECEYKGGPIIFMTSLQIIAGGLGELTYNFNICDISVAKIVAIIADHTISGLFLTKRSMITDAVSESPRKVRLAQIKGFCFAVKEFIDRKSTLFVPVKRTKTKHIRNIIAKTIVILLAVFMMSCDY